MRAFLNLRHSVPERARAFHKGLSRLGYSIQSGVTMRPGPKDILVSWNRIRDGQLAAGAFESRGRPVIVAENATWGNDFLGRHWYTLGRGYHNRADCIRPEGPERWDALGVELHPFRIDGETVILPQRGIGPPGVAMPFGWGEKALSRHGGRIRQHPGQNPCIPFEQDLKAAGRVVTWGSGAAVKALMMGIPVASEMPKWIGEQDNTEEGRLAMFRRLAWAQWTLDEIATGEPFERLLCAS